MARAKQRKPNSSRKTKSSKGKNGALPLLLRVLVVLLVMAAIALAAGYVYVRHNGKTKPEKTQETILPGAENPATGILSDTIAPTLLEGTWINSSNGTMLSIRKQAFSIDFSSVEAEKPISGSIHINGNKFVVETPLLDGCNDGRGTYEYSLAGDDLTISTLQDACTRRKLVFAAVWYKM